MQKECGSRSRRNNRLVRCLLNHALLAVCCVEKSLQSHLHKPSIAPLDLMLQRRNILCRADFVQSKKISAFIPGLPCSVILQTLNPRR